MRNKLNKFIHFFTTTMGIFVVAMVTIVGTSLTVLGIFQFFGDDKAKAVVPAEIVQTVLKNHQQQLAKKDQQLLSQDDLNQQLLELVETLLKKQDDLEAGEALNQLQVGQTEKAKAYFGRWTKVADNNIQAAKGARYAGTLSYLTDAEIAAKWYQEALQLNPNSEHNQILQSLVSELAASAEVSVQISTGKNSPVIKDTKIKGDFIIGDK